MRSFLFAVLVILASHGPSNAEQNYACAIAWPDPDISIPPQVRSYISWECGKFNGLTGESLQDCIRGEKYGYRAVVGMLSDPATSEKAAERYRACSAGLGDFGGRFHRRKAECMGTSFRYVWRFEFSQRASIGNDDLAFEVADRLQ